MTSPNSRHASPSNFSSCICSSLGYSARQNSTLARRPLLLMQGSIWIVTSEAGGLKPNRRIGPRNPRLGAAGFRAARWLGARLLGAAGFHQPGSDYADERMARVRERLVRGETVYLAGIGPPGTHNSGVALVEVTQAKGPRLIVNNEEERFSGNKHTTEYPRQSIDAMVVTLRGIGRDIGDIDAWLTGWDYV